MTKDNNYKLEFNFNLTKEEVEMKCAKGQKITEDEYMRFMTLCSSNNLNPFNDVHIIKTDYRTCIMIGKDGYFKMADSNPAYDGMEDGIIVMNPDGTYEQVLGCFIKQGQTLVGGWARAYRKDRKMPKFVSVMLSDYIGSSKSLWGKMPAIMINKVAKCSALRDLFPSTFAGTYDESEVSNMSEQGEIQQEKDSAQHVENPKAPSNKPNYDKELRTIIKKPDGNTMSIQECIESVKTLANAKAVIAYLTKLAEANSEAKQDIITVLAALKKGELKFPNLSDR